MKDCVGVIGCRELYPEEPKYWCEDCIDDQVSENEYRSEGDI